MDIKNQKKYLIIIYHLNEFIYLLYDLFFNFSIIYKLFDNWYDILLFKLGIKNTINIKFRKKYSVQNLYKVSNIEEYINFWSNILTINKKVSLVYIKRFNKEYNFLISIIKNKKIIDVGANIGDTPVCFAINGAKHVYAIEPYPYSYKIAQKAVKINGVYNKVTLINAACGVHRTININEGYRNTGGSDLSHIKKEGLKINVYSLLDLVKKIHINNDFLLKIDCEGCEYRLIISSSNVVLRKFKRIQIEYHYGYHNLIKKLQSAGFKTHYTFPRLHINRDSKNKLTMIGYVFAERIK